MDLKNKHNKLLRWAACTSVLATLTILIQKRRRKKMKKRMWSRKWLQRRSEGRGVLTMLNKELLLEDPASYRNYLRLTHEQFQKILNLIEGDIKRVDTFMRDCISAEARLEITLRFLATGESYRSLMYSCRVHESTISKFVPEVCQAIYKHLQGEYLKIPSTIEEWKIVSQTFYELWQFPYCLGAIDGKHITFRPPASDGSYYYNYKGDHSIVLLAMSDANYRFTYVNVGVNGRISDGGVFRESALSKAIVNNRLNFPPAEYLSGQTSKVPYVIVADDAFPLSTRLLKPYSQRDLDAERRIFNYRLSRARRVIENAFGILANRFRLLLNPINLCANKVEIITLCCAVLHNFLITENGIKYSETPLREELQEAFQQVGRQGGNRYTNDAYRVREQYKNFFCGAGAVDWQDNAVLQNNM